MYDIISYKIKMSLSSRRVRTLPFQGRNTGSSPVRLTKNKRTMELNIFVQHHNIIVHMAAEILVGSD